MLVGDAGIETQEGCIPAFVVSPGFKTFFDGSVCHRVHKRLGDAQITVQRIPRLREHCGSVSRAAGRVSVSSSELKCSSRNYTQCDASHKQQVRAACYCRISSDPKDKREGVDRQREDTAILCEIKGWQAAGVYIDNDRSASNGKHRPEWERLLADIEAGKIDAVAAWDQDRVNRMMGEFVSYRKLFVKRGILLATSNNGDIDLCTPTGVLTATIKTAVTEHEISMMKIRMRRAARQKAERGQPKWKRAFGYLGDTYQLDPHTAPLVKQAYAAMLAGSSLRDIARMFNDAGAYGLTGRPWTPSTVSLFLRKPRNAGLRAHNREIVGKGTWPALVDESTWRAAQSMLNAPGRAQPAARVCDATG